MNQRLINNRNQFLTVLKAGKFTDLCSSMVEFWWGSALQVAEYCLLIVSSLGRTEGKEAISWLSGHLSYSWELYPHSPTSHPNDLPKAPIPSTIALGGKVSTYGFGGNINIQSVTPVSCLFLWQTSMFPSLDFCIVSLFWSRRLSQICPKPAPSSSSDCC